MRTITIILFLISTVSSYAQTNEAAFNYLAQINQGYEQIQDDIWGYAKAISHSKRARKIEKRRSQLLKTLKETEMLVKRMRPFERDPMLRDATVNYLRLNQIIINEDFGKIVDLEAIAEESYDAMEAYILAKEVANDKLSKAGQQLDSVQNVFAVSNGINLVESTDKKSEKIKQAASVMTYYNSMYLVFFKSFKQEAYVLNDFSNKDMAAFEQNRNTLKTFSEEGIKAFEEIGSFKGDPMIKLAGLKMMNFYKQEASKFNEYAQMIVWQERMTKMSEYLESKKPSKRTQDDIDKYNNTLEKYNAAVDQFNKTNNYLNKKRNDLLEEWNKDVQKFFTKHVPK